MTISNAISLDEIISTLRDNEIEVAHLAEDIKTSRKKLDAAKLPSYSNFIAFLGSNAGTDLKNFAKFWTKGVAGSFKQGLVGKGVSAACAKRIAENGVGAFKVSAELRSAASVGPKAVEAWFSDNKITSERAVKGLSAKVVDPDEALARKLADFAPDRFSEIVKRVAALKEIETRKANGPNGVSKPSKAKPEELASEVA